MNDLVSVHDLLDELASLLIVHRPDLLDALVIGLLEPLKTLLELDELVSEQLVVLGVRRVQGLGLILRLPEELVLFTIALHILLKLGPQALLLLEEHRLALLEHIVIEAQFLLIQLVDGLHVLHALFKDLHLSLELDLLLGLLVGILAHGALEVRGVVILLLLPLVEVVLLNVAMLLEEVLNLDLVALEDVTALAVKL